MTTSIKRQLEDRFDLELSNEEAEHLVEDYGDPVYVECAAFGMFFIMGLVEYYDLSDVPLRDFLEKDPF